MPDVAFSPYAQVYHSVSYLVPDILLYPGAIFRFKACLYAVLEFFREFVQLLTHGSLFVGIECVQLFEQCQALAFYESRHVEYSLLLLVHLSVFSVLSVICVM